MRAVVEITQPSFQRWSIVLADEFAVSDDLGFTGDGGPFAAGVEEGDVDFGIGFQVIGFAGFGVGVEEEVEAAAFLYD